MEQNGKIMYEYLNIVFEFHWKLYELLFQHNIVKKWFDCLHRFCLSARGLTFNFLEAVGECWLMWTSLESPFLFHEFLLGSILFSFVSNHAFWPLRILLRISLIWLQCFRRRCTWSCGSCSFLGSTEETHERLHYAWWNSSRDSTVFFLFLFSISVLMLVEHRGTLWSYGRGALNDAFIIFFFYCSSF